MTKDWIDRDHGQADTPRELPSRLVEMEDKPLSKRQIAIDKAVKQLFDAAGRFSFYASQHFAKNTDESRAKAKANVQAALECTEAADELSMNSGFDNI